jgi:hypothetical protein
MKTPKKVCLTCRWASWPVKGRKYGYCEYPPIKLPVMPYCQMIKVTIDRNDRREIWPDKETKCPCHEPITTEQETVGVGSEPNLDVKLGVFVCNQFTGHYPAGTAAVVVAKNQEHAAQVLNDQLKFQGLIGDANANMMALVMTNNEQAVILNDGKLSNPVKSA